MMKVDNITKSYGNNTVLRGITYNFEKGNITTILAPNGSGKTTLLSIISGLLIPDSGTVHFYENWEPSDVCIVLAGEKNLYMKNTVLENLLYFGIIRGMKKREVTENIERFKDYLPFIGEAQSKLAEKLSYGQKRLLSIFSAIITNAKCIMIDEASEGLDMEYANILKILLRKSAEDRVIILASHDYDFVSKVSDRLIFLKDGKFIEEHGQLPLDLLKKRYMEIFNVDLGD
ncbi:MAG: ABC transporter ATP-binding protein [Clostridiaceae bacterium]|nr:ABC transporter ATP-binding protein [Clostridiaceae bacterium]